jgi:hypothetical protein
MGVVVSVGAGTRTEQMTAYQQTEPADVATLVEELRVARPWLVSRGRSGGLRRTCVPVGSVDAFGPSKSPTPFGPPAVIPRLSWTGR